MLSTVELQNRQTLVEKEERKFRVVPQQKESASTLHKCHQDNHLPPG